jgi:hypothetical protein
LQCACEVRQVEGGDGQGCQAALPQTIKFLLIKFERTSLTWLSDEINNQCPLNYGILMKSFHIIIRRRITQTAQRQVTTMNQLNLVFCIVLVSILMLGCQTSQAEPLISSQEPGTFPKVNLPLIRAQDTPIEPSCTGPQPPFVTHQEILQPLQMDEPVRGNSFRDPVFGTCLVRVSDWEADLPEEGVQRGLKNEYARVDSFNADESLLLLYSTDGEWFLYDAASLTPLGELPLGVEPRWDTQNPYLIYHIDETRLMVFDLNSGENSLVREFANDINMGSINAIWTRYEGRPSMDSRYWGLMAEGGDWIPLAFIVYDRLDDQVSVRDMRDVPGIEDDVDHVTISPKGTYFLASFDRACQHGELGDDANPCGLMVYDRDLENGRGLLRIVGHYDTALDMEGREVILYQDIDTDHISMLDLESGEITPLWAIDFSHTSIGFHFSGLAYEAPGWALVSTHSGGYPDAFTWMDNQVFAVELKAKGRVVRLAHTHSLVDQDDEHDYWAEPHASVNEDFTHIVFTSNWGHSGTSDVDAYLIQLPEGWIQNLP